MKLNRREFVKLTLSGTAASSFGALAGCGGGSGEVHAGGRDSNGNNGNSGNGGEPVPPPEGGRVVSVSDPAIAGETGTPNSAALNAALDKGMLLLTGASTIEVAWRRFFSPGERVGIKPNLMGGSRIATSTALLNACIDRLERIGVDPNGMVVWAPTPEQLLLNGLPIRPNGPGVRYTSTEGRFGEPISSGGFSGRLTTIITDEVDALLNLCVIKDHQTAGVTLSMKNHFGSIDNPKDHHTNGSDPAIADLNALPQIKDKARLFIADGSRGCFDGGPYLTTAGFFAYNGLLLSNDPVALDYQGWQIIEQRRAEAGLPTLQEAGREPRYISSAQARGVGTCDPQAVDVIVADSTVAQVRRRVLQSPTQR